MNLHLGKKPSFLQNVFHLKFPVNILRNIRFDLNPFRQILFWQKLSFAPDHLYLTGICKRIQTFHIDLIPSDDLQQCCLQFEGNGFLLLYKRLENGSFSWPRTPQEAAELTREQYHMLMMGLNPLNPKIKDVNPQKIFWFLCKTEIFSTDLNWNIWSIRWLLHPSPDRFYLVI